MSLAIDTFVANARSFCQWAESSHHDVLTARQLLLALMKEIPFLVGEGAVNEDAEYLKRTIENWAQDLKRFADFPIQHYQMMFSCLDLNDKSPVIGDVHDDFADIHSELWHGLQAFDHGDKTYAIQHWRESYHYHWGEHASSALRATDEYLRTKYCEEELGLSPGAT